MSKLRLRFLTGPRRGQQAVFSGPRVRIGRSRDNDLVLSDDGAPQSSGHHAEAAVSAGGWWLNDLDSTNGTFVNGARVTRTRLRSGDSISFGEDHFAVEAGRSILVPAGTAAVVVAALTFTYLWFGRSATNLERSAAVVARSVYLVAFEDPSGRRPLGTAFSVRADGLLATNAHVADVLRQRRADSLGRGRAIVIRSDSDEVREVLQVQLNPRWRVGSIADDVAVLRVDGSDPLVPLQLGDEAAVAALSRGTQLASVGFPADEVDAKRPRGRLTVDVLGDIRDQRYLAVGLEIAPGTSGSPIFRSDGVVVGLVAGGKFVSGPDGKAESTKINWGISVVALQELLTQLSARGPRHADFAWWGGGRGPRHADFAWWGGARGPRHADFAWWGGGRGPRHADFAWWGGGRGPRHADFAWWGGVTARVFSRTVAHARSHRRRRRGRFQQAARARHGCRR